MTTENIQWARLDDVDEPVAALDIPDDSYMYLERVPNSWLSEQERKNGLVLRRFDASADFSLWERGRVFCQDFEFRWEKLNGAFQAVYVGPPIELDSFALAQDLVLSETDPLDRGYTLWGRRVPESKLEAIGAQEVEGLPVFVDFQIPRLLRYPVEESVQRVQLLVREYRDPVTRKRLYFRFRGLEEER